MAYRVILTDKAEADVESVLMWFRDQRAAEAGGRWYAQLMAKLDTLENHPERCALAAESDEVGQEIRPQETKTPELSQETKTPEL